MTGNWDIRIAKAGQQNISRKETQAACINFKYLSGSSFSFFFFHFFSVEPHGEHKMELVSVLQQFH